MPESTRRRIVDTFWDMAFEEGGIAKITVWSLMKRVGMDRSTFYQYFKDIDGLLRFSADELVEELGGTWNESTAEAGVAEDVRDGFRKGRGPDADRKMMLLMWSGACPDLFDRLKAMIVDAELAEGYWEGADRETLEHSAGLVLMIEAGVVALHIRDWPEEGCDREIADYEKLAYDGMSSMGEFKPNRPVERSRRTRAPRLPDGGRPARTARRGRTKRGTGSPRRPPRRTCGRTRRRTPRRTRSGSCTPLPWGPSRR